MLKIQLNIIFEHFHTCSLHKICPVYRIMLIIHVDLQLPMQSVHITTKVVSSNPAHGEVIKFVSDLQQVCNCGFLRVLKFTCSINI
jgi:hypothetical protein